MRKVGLVLLVLLGLGSSVEAQTVRADRFQYATGSCTWRSGTGSPEAAVTGNPCDYWLQTDSPYDLWRKYSGTGNTGWLPVTSGSSGAMGGSGTSGRVAYWSGASTLTSDTDLLFDDSTGLLTTAKLWVTAYAPLIKILPSVVRLQSPDFPDEFTYDQFVDGTTGVVRLDAYNEDTSAYIPFKFRGLSFDFAGILTAQELQVQTLVAKEVMATIGGRIVVAPTTYLTADLASGGTTITLKHNSFSNGDRILLRNAAQLEWMAIASAAGGSAGAYTYTVTRNLDTTGANDWVIGDAAVNTGTTGDGYIDLFSDEGSTVVTGGGGLVGPTLVGVLRTGTTWSDLTPAWAVGNLTGLYGYTATSCSGGTLPCYGFASGNGSGPNITMDPTNGFRARSSTTDRIKLAADGSGFVANSLIAWDTSGNLTVTGNATIGGWEIGTTYIRAAADDVGISSAVTGGDDIRFWAGDATMSSAEFRVTESGALTATSATISGAITATSGAIGGCTIAATSITCGSGFSVSNAGVIGASSGTIGGFSIGADYIRDTGNSFGMASTITGGTDVRFWAGDTFANRATAPFSVDEAGYLRSTAATFGSGSTGVDVDTSGLEVNGGRILAGSGEVLIDDDGITITSGVAAGNKIKWTTGANIYVDSGDDMTIESADFSIDAGGMATLHGASGVALGQSAVGLFATAMGSATVGQYPVVRNTSTSRLEYLTDGVNGSCGGGGTFVEALTIEYGIVVGCTASAPLPLVGEVSALRAEVAELRQLIAMFMRGEGR